MVENVGLDELCAHFSNSSTVRFFKGLEDVPFSHHQECPESLGKLHGGALSRLGVVVMDDTSLASSVGITDPGVRTSDRKWCGSHSRARDRNHSRCSDIQDCVVIKYMSSLPRFCSL